MQIKIPSTERPILKQSNKSSILGDIVESFNLDLTTDLGKIKGTKTMLCKQSTGSESDPTDFGSTSSLGVGGFATLNNQIYLISGQRIWKGGNSPSDSFVLDTQTNTPTITIQTGDIKNFNSKLYATNGSNIYSSDGATWTNVYTYSNNGSHLLENHKGFLYFSYDGHKIGRMNTSNVPVTSGAGSLDLNLSGYIISFMKSDGVNLWIGLVNSTGGHSEQTYVYKWDGSTAGQAQSQYLIESRAIMSGCIVNGVPYVMDFNGRLLGFNGAFFVEVDKLPLKSNEYLYGVSTTHDFRGIHPNGMIYDSINDEILINISNTKSITDNVPTFHSFKGGVWAYKKETGLYHKYSATFQPIANTGTTGLTDYGQHNVILAGAITSISLLPSDKGRILFGQVVFPQETGSYITSGRVVLCSDDTLDTSEKSSYFITREIRSNAITDTWKQITALYQKLLNSTDKIILKYKTRNDIPTQVTITWSDIDRVTTSSDLSSSYSIGDEMQVIQGNGSGKCFKINSIAGTLVTFTESMPNGVIGLKGVALFNKWKYLGEVTYTDEQQYKTFTTTIQNTSPRIQIKVSMQFTGDNELDSVFINSDSLTKQ